MRATRIQRVARIVQKDKADELDMAFWKSKTPEEKLTALQTLREQYHLFGKGIGARASRKGLRRVHKAAKQA